MNCLAAGSPERKKQEAVFVSLTISPFTRKARWALELQKAQFKFCDYTAVIGEPWLRGKLGDWKGKVTLPVLLLPSDGALRESYDIALWGNKNRAQGAPDLFPEPHREAIRQWNEKGNLLLGFGRIAGIANAKQKPASVKSMLPPPMQQLGPLTTGICSSVLDRLEKKYKDQGASREQALAVLTELSAALKTSGGLHLVGGSLSYADITMAVPLELLTPKLTGYDRLGGAPDFELPDMLKDFPDLVAWRDSIYAKFFPKA